MFDPDKSKFYYDTKTADAVVKAVHSHFAYPTSGPGFSVGESFRLMPWQIPHLQNIFAWKDKETHARMIRDVLFFTPKKNGKTSFGAICALLLLLLDPEPSKTIMSLATSAEQAKLCFDMAAGMISQSDTLGREVEQGNIVIQRREIIIPETNSRYKVATASPKSIHGPSTSAVLFDEFHAQSDRKLYDYILGAGKSRLSPLRMFLTTAGWDRTSICYELYEYAKKVQEGYVKNDRFYPIIYECPRDGDGNYLDWKLESTWRAANPNFDLMNRDEFINEFNKALEMPSAENGFKQLSLNIWTNQSTRWMPYEVWDKCRTTTSFKDLIEQNRGKRAVAGLDVAPVSDTSSLVVLVPQEDGKVVALTWIWIPNENAVEKEQRDRVPYSTWASATDGGPYVLTTPGNTTDYDNLYSQIKGILEQFQVTNVGFDNAFVGPLAQWLNRDFGEDFAVQVPQSYDVMSPAVGHTENMIRSQKLIIPHHPAFDWQIGNAEVKRSNGRQILNKAEYIRRCDSASAMCIAFKRLMVEQPPEQEESVYETQSILLI